MRITEFRRRMADEFGRLRAQTIAKDYVLGALGGRTADEALEAGVGTRDIWQAVCDAFEVPTARR